ncbi:hypothetical protein FJT64_014730 [Amphibalanus amphitrite]|uniref:Uncharacterized protein n=1 Tax=Amphibalanus amphitrite TaxID=1232801 RepID=A0A6A4V5E9_AMPAM|nr:hypothetical protein FJT64_014730 [Amphibalanus amphitrite]
MTEGEPLTAEQAQILFESEQIHMLLGGGLGAEPSGVSSVKRETNPFETGSFDKIMSGLFGSGSVPPISLPMKSSAPGPAPVESRVCGTPCHI